MRKYYNNCSKNNRAWCFVLFLLGLGQGIAQTPTINWTTPLPVDTTIQRGQLPNGLRYYLLPHNEPQDRAEFRLVVGAGSLQEEADQLGVAHFVEHMAFNGTRHFAKNTLIDFIERSGSRFGADLNAYTSFAETVYQLQVQTDSLPLLDTALQILADWAAGISFAEKDVEEERGIIRSEWRSGLSSNQRLQLQTYQALLPNSRYAVRFPIGSPELIDTVAAQRLIDFYQRWYQPANMAVIVVGNFDPAWMEVQIGAYFSALENTDFNGTPTYPLDTTARQTFLLATDDEAAFTRWEINYQLEKMPPENTLGSLRTQLLRDLYGRLLNQRMAQVKETEVPPFTFAYSGFSSLPGDYQTYRLSALAPADQLEATLEKVLLETRRVVQHGFTDTELNREKKALAEGIQQMVRELDKRSSASLAANLRSSHLAGNYTIPDLAQLPAMAKICLDAISPADLAALARQWPAARVRTAIITTNARLIGEMPDSTRFFAVVDSMLRLEVPPYRENAASGPLLLPPAVPGQATLLAMDTCINLATYQLSNGAKLYLKPTDFSNDQIRMTAFSTGGMGLYGNADYPSARHAVAIADQSGLDTFKESELLRLLSDRQVSLRPYLGEYEEGLQGSSNQADLTTFFQLAYLYFTRPRFDSLALVAYQDRQRNIYERLDEDPRTAFGRMVIDIKYNHHPHRSNTSLAEFDQIDLARCQNIYRERFANAADFSFLFVGNFNTDSLLLLAAQYLATLPASAAPAETWQDAGLRLVDHPLDTTLRAGQTPKAEVILEWHGAFPFGDTAERFHFSALRQLLNTRLRERLREEMGGVYGVRINSRYQAIPDSLHHTTIRFNAEEEQVDTLIAAVYQEIRALAAGKIGTADLAKIKAAQFKSYEEALRNNGFWLSQIQRCLENGFPLDALYPGHFEAKLETLTAEGLAQAAQNYLVDAIPFRFVLLPGNAAKQE